MLAHTYVSWYDLPETFRNHPLFTLDNDILKLCDSKYVPMAMSKNFDVEVINEMKELFKPVDDNVDLPESHAAGVQELPMDTSEREINSLCFQIREQCSLISTVTYNAFDLESTKITLDKLTDVYKELYRSCEDETGAVRLKKSDLGFRTLKDRKPKKPGMYGNRRITPMYKPSKGRMKINQPGSQLSTSTPLVDIIGDLPETVSEEPDVKKRRTKAVCQPRIDAPPCSQGVVMEPDEVTDVTLDFLLTNAQEVFVDEETMKGLDNEGSGFTPFADINAYKRSIKVRIPDKIQKMKPTEVKCKHYCMGSHTCHFRINLPS